MSPIGRIHKVLGYQIDCMEHRSSREIVLRMRTKYHVAVGRLLKQTGALLRRSADHRSTDRQSPQAICEIHLTPKGRHPRQRLIGVRQRTLHIRHRAAELDLLVDAYLTARLCPGQKGPSSSQLVDWQ